MNYLKLKTCVFKNKGQTADGSFKIETYTDGNVTNDQAGQIASYHKMGEVDIIIMPSGQLEKIEEVFDQIEKLE